MLDTSETNDTAEARETRGRQRPDGEDTRPTPDNAPLGHVVAACRYVSVHSGSVVKYQRKRGRAAKELPTPWLHTRVMQPCPGVVFFCGRVTRCAVALCQSGASAAASSLQPQRHPSTTNNLVQWLPSLALSIASRKPVTCLLCPACACQTHMHSSTPMFLDLNGHLSPSYSSRLNIVQPSSNVHS